MAVYDIINDKTTLETVEFIPVSEGNVAFFTAPSAAARADLLRLIKSTGLGQQITDEAVVHGKPVIITSGPATQGLLMEALKAHGLSIAPHQPADKNHTWKIISMLAVPGQFLQLASSVMRKDKKLDWGMLAFASSNLVGHAITWNYGAQSYEDKNRLTFLKGEINKELSPHLPQGERLPAVSDSRKELRHDHHAPTTLGQRMDSFLEANSIYVGEIACRYMGALALAFPPDRWRKITTSGGVIGAYNTARNPSAFAHSAGIASLSGKTLSLMAKAEDPYQTKPHTALDTFREKIAFQAGGWIEAGAFGTLTYDALCNPNRRIVIRGKEYRDYVGALGSALFTARYVMRHWAKFGERRIDMDEVYAHATDSLAKMPQGRIAELVNHTATALTEHFKDENLTYGEVYTRLKSDLYTYHHIVVPESSQKTSAPRSFVSALPRGFATAPQSAARAMPGGYAEMIRAHSHTAMGDGSQLVKGA
ncbi:MAG: hypothetical protein EBV03_02150 [Proteobacteria bacterium]|nr:hypothetical protein [Pseudomonadota bacterium]